VHHGNGPCPVRSTCHYGIKTINWGAGNLGPYPHSPFSNSMSRGVARDDPHRGVRRLICGKIQQKKERGAPQDWLCGPLLSSFGVERGMLGKISGRIHQPNPPSRSRPWRNKRMEAATGPRLSRKDRTYILGVHELGERTRMD